MKYDVSVVIPVYNREKYIVRCVESVLSQSGSERFKVILVDDGSTDGSPAICDELEQKYENVFAVHQKNAGVSAARNTGIENAEGEWLSFIDSDDYVLDGFYGKLISEPTADLLCCDFYTEDDEFPLIGEQIKEGIFTKETFPDVLYPVMCQRIVFYSACNKIFRTDIIKKHGLRFIVGKKYAEDMTFVYEYVRHIESFKFVNERLYSYYFSGNSASIKIEKSYETYESTYIFQRDYFKSLGYESGQIKHEYLFTSLGAIYNAAVTLGILSAYRYIRNILKNTIFYEEYSSNRIYCGSEGINGYLDKFIIKKRPLLIIALARLGELNSKRIEKNAEKNNGKF